ncbi:ATP-grasp domain-containing protein [Metabacillus bambusae]|uniref:ATP-grasp domain-containing protein n=1 Tax=Metabacillus bambusae TaxID=2795218 RepID=A0ABS3MWQ3_9BACI|nr:ATP-grasp domain-containing protein [Metabacillus bambusae]MBO1510274.1 ATP-grasp domain-containing protein [Metabacillus bambusae]
MKTIVFIGTNKSGSSRDAIKAAEELGYFTVLFTDRENFFRQRDEFPDVHLMIYLKNLSYNEELIREIERLSELGKSIKGCISYIDPFVYVAARLSEYLGLVHLSTKALYRMEDKTRTRDHLSTHPSTPSYTILPFEAPLTFCIEKIKDQLPLVLKIPVSNGSKDVILVKSIEEFTNGFLSLRRKYPTSSILVEEFLNGTQYIIEIVVCNGKIEFAGVIEQKIDHKYRFIVTGYEYPAVLTEEAYTNLINSVTSILKCMEFTDGSCHLEMRFVNGVWKLIEINPRISGGAMNEIIMESTGINLAKEILKLTLGLKSFQTINEQKYVYAHYLTVNSTGRLLKITGKNRASAISGVRKVYVKPRKGTILTIPMSMGDRYAYVLAAADTPEEAKRIAMKAAKEIKFYLVPL